MKSDKIETNEEKCDPASYGLNQGNTLSNLILNIFVVIIIVYCLLLRYIYPQLQIH